MFRNYECVVQHDTNDCGAACLATVARHHGLNIPLSRIRKLTGTNLRGTTALGIVQAADKMGFRARGVQATIEHLKRVPLPAIAHIVREDAYHFVVVHKVSHSKIVIADPAEGVVTCERKDFVKRWSGVLIILVPDSNLSEGNQALSPYAWLMKIIFPNRKLLLGIFVTSLLYTLLGIIGALYFRILIDDIVPGRLLRNLHIVSAGFVLLIVFRVVLDGIRHQLLLYLGQNIDWSLMTAYYRHIIHLPMSFFDTRTVGGILARLSDASRIRDMISGAALTVMIDSILIVAGGIVLYIQSSYLFWIASVLVPPYIFIMWIFSSRYRDVQRSSMEKSAKLESFLVNSLKGISSLKSFTGEEDAEQENETKFCSLLNDLFRDGRMRNIQSSFQKGLTLTGEAVILWVGGSLVIRGEISTGQLISFYALLAYFFKPIQNLAGLQPILHESIVAVERLMNIFVLEAEELSETNKICPSNFAGSIEFRNVCFKYGNEGSVFRGLSFKIKPGMNVGLVGRSGTGKTSLAKLILRYYSPQEGDIFLGGHHVEDMELLFLREKVGYIAESHFFFRGRLRENLLFGLSGISMEDVSELAAKLQMMEMINQFPLRFETPIGEGGANLSGGQKQRLAILHMLLKRPKILILDEATSNLDPETEKTIMNAIEALSWSMTRIVITHRLTAITGCDLIMVLDSGGIREQGSHRHLILKKGLYYKMWNRLQLE